MSDVEYKDTDDVAWEDTTDVVWDKEETPDTGNPWYYYAQQ